MPTTVTNHEALQLVVAVHRLVRSLRQAAPARRLQPTQLLVLSELSAHGPMRIGEIAVRALCSQPTATTVVTSLESTGLVRREPDAADGRATIVVLMMRYLGERLYCDNPVLRQAHVAGSRRGRTIE